MGERKGQNMYYPPDYDPRKGGLNKSQGTHALRERARKLHLGILVIRFEMPYNIWCEGCGNHIAMGVRYNAEKKKVGMYYTTPIHLFRMKCHLCDNHFEIKTDPGNLDYVITSGARRQEKRFKAEENGTVIPEEKSTIAKIATDSMFKLQHDGIDRGKGKDAAPTIAKIVQIQDRAKDDYMANRQLRDTMRSKRNAANSIEISNSDLLSRTSLQGSIVKLLPEESADSETAALLRLAPVLTSEEKRTTTRDAIMEDGSIFDFVKTSVSSKIIKSGNIKDKEHKIDSFKKIVARKRHLKGISPSPLNLGIKKNANAKKSKTIEKETTINPDKLNILSEPNKLKPYSRHGEDLPTKSDAIFAPCNQTKVVSCNTDKDSEMSSMIERDINLSESASIVGQDAGKHSKTSSLSLLCGDYGSSNSSSDNE